MWAVFIAFVLFMLALDLFVLGGRKAHKVSVKEAALGSLVWVSLALAEKKPDLTKNPVLRFARRHLRIADGDHGEKFTVIKDGVRHFTPLFLVLILIEVTVMGLRALYFLLADVADRFHLLKYGLAMVLTIVGTKMLIVPWYHMPVAASLAVVTVLIGSSVIASLIATCSGSAPRH